MFIRRFKVQGRSMLPSFAEGDYVITRPFRRLKKGDVVVTRAGGMLLLKRVEAEASGLFYVAGDNRGESPGARPVHRRDIVGKVAFHSRQELKGEGLL